MDDVDKDAPQAEVGSSTGPHKMRITSGGSMKGYISFALQFLQDHPNRPLILHTLPPPPSDSLSVSKRTTTDEASRALRPPTLTAPRLINLVEIIKREHIARLEKTGTGKGKHRAVGVWQYTETGLVPAELMYGSEGQAGKENDEGEELARILGGKTRPKMSHHPYLQITLSTRPLGLENQHMRKPNGDYTFVTCQHITIPRARKHGRSKTNEGADSVDATSGGESRFRGEDGAMDLDITAGGGSIAGEGDGEVEVGVSISRDDMGTTIARSTAKPDIREVAASKSLPTAIAGPPEPLKASRQTAVSPTNPVAAPEPGSTDLPAEKKESIKEKKRRRQISNNAIDAEFDSLFGKTLKKKKKKAEV